MVDVPSDQNVVFQINEEYSINEFDMGVQFKLQDSVSRVIIFKDEANEHELDLQFTKGLGIMKISGQDYIFGIDTKDIKLFSWTNFMFSINETGYYIVVDGKLWSQEVHYNAAFDLDTLKIGEIEFGYESLIDLQITNFHIWIKAWDLPTNINYTIRCSDPNGKLFFDWRNVTKESFYSRGGPEVKIQEFADWKELCRDHIEAKTLLMKNSMNFTQARDFCQILGGNLVYPYNVTLDKAESYYDKCTDGIWTPFYKKKEQDNVLQFFNNVTKELIQLKDYRWRKNEPNGKLHEKCAVIDTRSGPSFGLLMDVSCTESLACFYCRFDRIQAYTMKGIKDIEKETLIGSRYHLDMNELYNDLPAFKGVSSSSIIFDQSKNRWSIYNGNQLPGKDSDLVYAGPNHNVIGYSEVNAKRLTSPVGTYAWNFTDEALPQRLLKFSKVTKM